jgi:broad specificity phosphatase PhoE
MTAERLIRLVRHGRAAAGWDSDPDPDLDDLGRAQADAVAHELAIAPPLVIVSSPLLRCRSTARALADRTGVGVVIRPEVAEIPSPEGVDMADRVEWLRVAMQGTWSDLGARYTSYRDAVVCAVAACAGPTVVYSHFIAINAVIGACLGDDRLVIRSLDNCSVTSVAATDGALRLVESGREADTLIR